jgi:hypothetical protein
MTAGEMASEQSRDEPSKRGYRSRIVTLRSKRDFAADGNVWVPEVL